MDSKNRRNYKSLHTIAFSYIITSAMNAKHKKTGGRTHIAGLFAFIVFAVFLTISVSSAAADKPAAKATSKAAATSKKKETSKKKTTDKKKPADKTAKDKKSTVSKKTKTDSKSKKSAKKSGIDSFDIKSSLISAPVYVIENAAKPKPKPKPNTAKKPKPAIAVATATVIIPIATSSPFIAPSDILSAVDSIPPEAANAAPATGRVLRVSFTAAGAPPEIWIDQGINSGVIPSMSLEIISRNRVIGHIEVVKTDSGRSLGVFSGACHACVPQVGDLVRLGGRPFSKIPPAPINVPTPGNRPGLKGGNFAELDESFRLFMAGKVLPEVEPTLEPLPDLPDPTPARTLPNCPEGISAMDSPSGGYAEIDISMDEDIKAGYFLEHGDRLRVENWPPYSPFCPMVDIKGYIRFPDVGLISATKRTVASLELFLRNKLKVKNIDVQPVLIPVPAGAVPLPTEFFILGEVVKPGYYEFDTQETTVSKAVNMAGGVASDSDGTAVVVDDLSRKWEFRLVKLSELNKEPADKSNPASMTAREIEEMSPDEILNTKIGSADPEIVHDRSVIFLPASREHLEQFIRDVLPYLEN